MIGIIGALDEEIALLRQDMEIKEVVTVAKCEYIAGTLKGTDVVVTKCGMGKVNAASCTAVMIQKFSPDMIINTGVGGSLCAELKVLDIAIAEDIVQHDYDLVPLGYQPAQVDLFETPYFICDKAVNAALKKETEKFGYRSVFARFATGDCFVEDPAEKCRLADTFSAKVCDMESGAIAQVCALNGVRFAAIRAISDSGSDPDGAMQFFQFLKAAATHSVTVLGEIFAHAKEL